MIDRMLDSFRRSVRSAFPWLGYAGTYEYTVFEVNGSLYGLRPTKPISGLPIFGGDLPDAPPTPVKPGVPGVTSLLVVGALVLVTFIDCDPARAVIVAVAGPDDAGFMPTSVGIDASGQITIGHASSALSLGGGYQPVIRNLEAVILTSTSVVTIPPGTITSAIIKGTLTFDPSVETGPGAPPTGFSTVKA